MNAKSEGRKTLSTLCLAGLRNKMSSLTSLNISSLSAYGGTALDPREGLGQSAFEWIAEGCRALLSLDLSNSIQLDNVALIKIGLFSADVPLVFTNTVFYFRSPMQILEAFEYLKVPTDRRRGHNWLLLCLPWRDLAPGHLWLHLMHLCGCGSHRSQSTGPTPQNNAHWNRRCIARNQIEWIGKGTLFIYFGTK